MKIFMLVLQGVPFLDNEQCRARDVIIGRHEAMRSSALRCAAPRKKNPCMYYTDKRNAIS